MSPRIERLGLREADVPVASAPATPLAPTLTLAMGPNVLLVHATF